MLWELAVRSPEAVWLRSACRFYNALAAAPEGSLQHAVALSDWDDAISCNVQNWAWSLQSALSDKGYAFHIDRHRLFPLDITAIMERHDARAAQCWEACDVSPRTCDTDGAALCKFIVGLPCPKMPPLTPSSACPSALRRSIRWFSFGWVS